MMGLEYISKQVYSYNDYDQLIDTLDKTQAADYIILQDQQIIEYMFDRKKYIRLSDLIYWIKIKLIRFHLGQLLDLFENLLLYVQNIYQKGIQHNYLDCNRIWLKLKNESEYPNIVHSKLLYDIIFTGYQCLFYENIQTQVNEVEFQIIELILEIINKFKQEQISLIKNMKFQDKQINIYDELLQKDQYQTLQSFLSKIEKLKKNYNYDGQSQMLSFDQSTNKFVSLRNQRIQDVRLPIENIIKTLVGKNNQYIQERIFNKILIQIVPSIDNFGLYKAPNFNLEQICQQQEQKYNQIETELRKTLNHMINCELMKLIKQCQEHFKFNFSQEEIQQMAEDILKVVLSKKLFNYFRNCHLDKSQELFNLKISMGSKVVLEVIHELFNLTLYLKIIYLIQDLI